MRTVVFDLDGTLADTSGDLIAAANACFRRMGVGDLLDPQKDAGTALTGGKAMLRLGMERLGRPDDEEEVNQQYPTLLEAYETSIDRYTVLYPGALEAVDRLTEAGFKTAVCTNKPEGLARLLFTRMGVLDRFDALVGADTLPVRKPDPEPLREAVRMAGGMVERALMIGDTITDHSTARAAGVLSVLVAFTPSRKDIAAMKPDALLNHFDDLPDLAERLLGPA